MEKRRTRCRHRRSSRYSSTRASTLLAPIIIAHTIDAYIETKNFGGVLEFSGHPARHLCPRRDRSNYVQVRTMGGVGRRVLFNLRNAIFTKLQELPVAFFNQNKAGDLISRINNDTDKLNQFFAQALMQFLEHLHAHHRRGIFLLVINIKLGAASLVPALIVLVLTQLPRHG